MGVISYTISTVVGAIEGIAEEILDREGGQPFHEKPAIPKQVAEEVFDSIGQKGIAVPPPDIPADLEIGAPLEIVSPDPTASKTRQAAQVMVTPKPIYEDVTVTKYYLRYGYDLDDIPNARLRSDFTRNAARVFQKSTAQASRRQAEGESESRRLREQSERAERRNRERRAEKLQR